MRSPIVPFQRAPRSLLLGLGAAMAVGAALLAVALFLARLQPAPLAPASVLTQEHEGGGVTVKATWLADQQAPTFSIVLDTHSVALDGYDLRQLAVLRVNGSIVSPLSWDAPAGGHHRSGRLTFPARAADGDPLLTAQTPQFELILRGIGDVPERVLTWAR